LGLRQLFTLSRNNSALQRMRRKFFFNSSKQHAARMLGRFGSSSAVLWARTLPPSAHTVRAWWRRLRAGLQPSQRKGFDSLFALVSWQLWKERNARCFRESAAPAAELLLVIKAQADLWVQAGAKRLGSLFSGG
jgi:hypothetical protein